MTTTGRPPLAAGLETALAEHTWSNDGVTIPCAVCQRAFIPSGRRRFCSDACRQAAWRQRHPLPPPPMPTRSPRPATIYECGRCGARYLGQQRCDDCHIFARRIGPGGPCPHCDQPVALADLLPDAGRDGR